MYFDKSRDPEANGHGVFKKGAADAPDDVAVVTARLPIRIVTARLPIRTARLRLRDE